MAHNTMHPSEQSQLSPAAQEVLTGIAEVRNRSDLRNYSGRVAFGLLRRKEITLSEFEMITNTRAERFTQMTISGEQAIPQDIPESPVFATPEWSPTAILHTMPQTHEFDARERAAGEYLDRA